MGQSQHSCLDRPTLTLTRHDADNQSLAWTPLIGRLIIASNYEPYSIIEKLSKYIAGSANIVVYSPFLQVRPCSNRTPGGPLYHQVIC